MMIQESKILLNHGSGGRLSRELVADLFFKYFDNEILSVATDSAVLPFSGENLAFTTDSFVVDPLFFPGGDIGKLAVCGTVNDLAVSGAKPRYLSAGFIIEEGFPFKELEKIVRSMAETANSCGVKIVTGDTKVINRGQCDKLFINTAGVGEIKSEYKNLGTGKEIKHGDKIIINGSIADHGMAVMVARNELNVGGEIYSDCAPLNKLIRKLLNASEGIKFMRDATRGGLATVLSELCENKSFGIDVFENSIKVKDNVRGVCEFFGFDPLYVANEGKVVIVTSADKADLIIEILQNDEFGKDSSIIGEIVEKHQGKTYLKTKIGGKRMIDMLAGQQLPRIC